MWAPALATLGAILVLQLMSIFSTGLRPLASGLELGVCAFIGWRGNGFYRAHTDRMVAQARAMTQDRNGQTAWLQAQGGTAMPGALGLAGGFFVLWVLIFFVLANQARLAGS